MDPDQTAPYGQVLSIQRDRKHCVNFADNKNYLVSIERPWYGAVWSGSTMFAVDSRKSKITIAVDKADGLTIVNGSFG